MDDFLSFSPVYIVMIICIFSFSFRCLFVFSREVYMLTYRCNDKLSEVLF